MKYVNPGIKILVDYEAATEIISDEKNPINGKALYGYFNITLNNIVNMYKNLVDIYCKFDVFCVDKNNFSFSFNGLKSYAGNIDIDTTYDECYFSHKASERYDLSDMKNHLIDNSLNSFFIHCNLGTIVVDEDYDEITGAKNGTLELKINDYDFSTNLDYISFGRFVEDLLDGDKFNFNVNASCPVSNIIISNEVIDSKEQIIILPISVTDTDMTDNGDGSYTATKEDQYILQTVDAGTLIKKFGGKSEITSIIMAGLPAYKTVDGLSSLICLESSNNNIVEDTRTTRVLSTYYEEEDYYEDDEDEYYEGKPNILITKSIENITLKDLTGKQYGFKVGV